NTEMFRFCQELIAFRRAQPAVRRATFLTGSPLKPGELPDVSWYSPSGRPMDWGKPSQSLICIFGTAGLETPAARPIMLILHPGPESAEFVIPAEVRHLPWKLFINTSAAMPNDIFPGGNGPALPAEGKIELIHHTMVC